MYEMSFSLNVMGIIKKAYLSYCLTEEIESFSLFKELVLAINTNLFFKVK